MGSYAEAVDAFKQGLERYPQSERLHLWLAASHAQIDEAEQAKQHMDHVFDLNPEFSPSFLERASPFRYETDLDNFLDGVRKAMRVNGSTGPAVTESVTPQ